MEDPAELIRRELYHRHRATAADAPEQRAAGADHSRRVVERQRAGDVGGGHLSHAVADDGHRLDPPFAPELGEGHLYRK